MTVRPWTLDVIGKTAGPSLKRACNGCGNTLGDVEDRELQGAIVGAGMPDVVGECGFCAGHHVLYVIPDPVTAEDGMTAEEVAVYVRDPEVTYSVLCPNNRTILDPEKRSCIMYRLCGCVPPESTTSTEEALHDAVTDASRARYAAIEVMEQQPCPGSLTGQHRWFPHAGFLSPTQQCIVADNDWLHDAGPEVASKPGAYPIDFDVEEDHVNLYAIDLTRSPA